MSQGLKIRRKLARATGSDNPRVVTFAIFVRRATEVTRELGTFLGLQLNDVLQPEEPPATPVMPTTPATVGARYNSRPSRARDANKTRAKADPVTATLAPLQAANLLDAPLPMASPAVPEGELI